MTVLVTGARGVVGAPLCEVLEQSEMEYAAVSRLENDAQTITWDLNDPSPEAVISRGKFECLIHCAPIWLLSAHMQSLANSGINRFIVFSSTSVLGKADSGNEKENQLVDSLLEAENEIKAFCSATELELWILRPSMIYGYGRDQNISHLAGFIRRYRFAVVAGEGRGLRQPVHADDLVSVCLQILRRPFAAQQLVMNAAGGEQVSYTQMLERIFQGLRRKPRIFRIPLGLFRWVLRAAALVGRFDYTSDMADRMNKDLVYSNDELEQLLGYRPQSFLKHPERDLPRGQ